MTAISDTGLTRENRECGNSNRSQHHSHSSIDLFFIIFKREFHGKLAVWFLINSVLQFNVTCKFIIPETHSTTIIIFPLSPAAPLSFSLSRHFIFTMQTSNYKTQLYVPGVMLVVQMRTQRDSTTSHTHAHRKKWRKRINITVLSAYGNNIK